MCSFRLVYLREWHPANSTLKPNSGSLFVLTVVTQIDRLTGPGSVCVLVAGQVVPEAGKMFNEANNFYDRNSAMGTEK